MAVLGVYNLTTQSLEGSDDPGTIFVRRLNICTLISALSLRAYSNSKDAIQMDQVLR